MVDSSRRSHGLVGMDHSILHQASEISPRGTDIVGHPAKQVTSWVGYEVTCSTMARNLARECAGPIGKARPQ